LCVGVWWWCGGRGGGVVVVVVAAVRWRLRAIGYVRVVERCGRCVVVVWALLGVARGHRRVIANRGLP